MTTKSVTTMTDEGFAVLISQIKRLGKLTNNAIQRAAVFAVWKSIEDRNATPARTLFDAMPSGTRRQALIVFFEKHGNLCFSTANKRIEFFDVEDLTGTPCPEFNEDKMPMWHTMAKEPDLTSAWDVTDQVEKVLARLEKAVDHKSREVLNADLIGKIREVMYAGASGV